MKIKKLENWTRIAIAGAALINLAAIFYGIWRGLKRPVAVTDQNRARFLRSPVFYPIASGMFFGFCALIWRPLRISLSLPVRLAALIAGALLALPGLALVLWGRLTLGASYNVSSTIGAPLYAEHRLITRGPYAWMRHPMYTGMILATLGGALVYRTWTLVFLFVCSLGLLLRARREEEALDRRYGEVWQSYAQQTPPFWPRGSLQTN